MTPTELDAHLLDLYPGGPHTEPRFWRDSSFSRPAQPVVGICWYEARAYLRWLSAQSGRAFRLPTEVEWEAAARGAEGRIHAYGNTFDRMRGNTAETHVRRLAPIGVFPDGDSPTGICDLTGNSYDWTSSAYGRAFDVTDYPYPYRTGDGREEADVPADVQRVTRGGSWYDVLSYAAAPYRGHDYPGFRDNGFGMRVATSDSIESR